MKSIVSFEGKSYNKFPKYILKGIYGIDFNFKIVDENGIAIDLVGKIVTLKIKNSDTGVLIINSACDHVSDPDGLVKYTILSPDFNTRGIYEAILTVSEGLEYNNIVGLGVFGVVDTLLG